MTPTIAALVPMRHASERVPGKNYRELAGKPLYHYVIEALLGCEAISRIVIDTDSPTIMEDAGTTFPGVTVIERPTHLRGGSIPMNEVLLHDTALISAELYLQTHSTNPLLRSSTIATAIDGFLAARPDYDSLFGVTRLQTRLWTADGRALNHDPEILLRTQDLPPVYEENSCLYLFDGDTLRRRHNRIGERPMLFEVPRDEAFDIDEEIDWQIVAGLLSSRPQ